MFLDVHHMLTALNCYGYKQQVAMVTLDLPVSIPGDSYGRAYYGRATPYTPKGLERPPPPLGPLSPMIT